MKGIGKGEMSILQPDSSRTLYRRFEFDDYEATRGFLDRLANLCERSGFYPNVDFGTTYVRVAIEPSDQARLPEGGAVLVAEIERLARQA